MPPMQPPRLDLDDLDCTPAGDASVPSFVGRTAEAWIGAVAELGPILRIEVDGESCVALCGQAANEGAWKNPKAWLYGPPSSGGVFFDRHLGSLHISGQDGDPHRRSRKLLLPSFGIAAVTRDIDVVAETVTGGLDALDDKTTDLHEALTGIYAAALSRTQVKVALDAAARQRLALFEEAFIASAALPESDQLAWMASATYQGLKADAFALFERIVDARLAGERAGDSLDAIIERPPVEGMAALDREELVRATYLLLIAGVGNIAKLLSSLLWALSKRSAWMDRLRAETAGFDPGMLKNGVKDLPVIRAVIQEAERCFLPAAVVPKVAAHDVDLCGFRIPGGTQVLHLHGLAHFEAERFHDPFSFRPERWLDGDAPRVNAFGGGIHLCLGMGVTRLYLPLTLGLLMRDHTWTPHGPPRPEPLFPDLPVSPPTVRFDVHVSAGVAARGAANALANTKEP